jgi:hypothetical protein
VARWESQWRLTLVSTSGIFLISCGVTIKGTLMTNPDFKEAAAVGRIDILVYITKKMNVSSVGAMSRTNFFDARVYRQMCSVQLKKDWKSF